LSYQRVPTSVLSHFKHRASRIVVIFRAKVRQVDGEYTVVAARLRELALEQVGCLKFQAVNEGKDEVALSYWPNEDSIRAWKSHAEHVLAQQSGSERWYQSYVVQVVQIGRKYRFDGSPGA